VVLLLLHSRVAKLLSLIKHHKRLNNNNENLKRNHFQFFTFVEVDKDFKILQKSSVSECSERSFPSIDPGMLGFGQAEGVQAVGDLGGSILTGIDGNPLAVLCKQLRIPQHNINTSDVKLYMSNGRESEPELDGLVCSRPPLFFFPFFLSHFLSVFLAFEFVSLACFHGCCEKRWGAHKVARERERERERERGREGGRVCVLVRAQKTKMNWKKRGYGWGRKRDNSPLPCPICSPPALSWTKCMSVCNSAHALKCVPVYKGVGVLSFMGEEVLPTPGSSEGCAYLVRCGSRCGHSTTTPIRWNCCSIKTMSL
jgi:hypothetical protein